MEDEILQATAALVTALERGDVTAAADLYTGDAKLLAPAPELIQGRAAIASYWRAGVSLGLSAVWFEAHVLEPVGKRVVEVGRYAVSVDVERARPVVERGTYVVLHRQAGDGSWQRALDVFDPDEPMVARPEIQREEKRNEEGT